MLEDLDMILRLDADTVVQPTSSGFQMETTGTVSGDFGVEPLEPELINCSRI